MPIMIRNTMKKVAKSHIRKFRRPRRIRSWVRLCEGSVSEPYMAIRIAPPTTKTVPITEYLVNGSCRSKVAHAVLKTNPEACNVDSTGSGSVVI